MWLRDDVIEAADAPWPLDHVRPPDGAGALTLGGHGPPHGRDPADRCTAGPDCVDSWSWDDSYLPRSLDPGLLYEWDASDPPPVAYDFGHGHRTDKGVFESLRHSKLQNPDVDTGIDGYGDRGTSLRELYHRQETAVEHDVLVYNCKLTHLPPDGFHKRKKELGRMLKREGYDVAALCELFRTTSGKPDKKMRNYSDTVDYARGKGVNWGNGVQDSGLEVDCLENETGIDADIVDADTGSYDYDYYSNREGKMPPTDRKGWLLTELDLGPGHVDLFVTHTAGDLPEVPQLCDAISEHSKPRNPTLVVGDLNISPHTSDYEAMVEQFAELDLQDAWHTRGGIEGVTNLPDTSKDVGNLSHCNDYEGTSGNSRPCACNDYEEAKSGAVTRKKRYEHHDEKRIDYVFVEQPKPWHATNLDLSRIERRVFPRTEPCGHGTMNGDPDPDFEYLSDHIGLSFRTVVSPKRDLPPVDALSMTVQNLSVSEGQKPSPIAQQEYVVVDATVEVTNGASRPIPRLLLEPSLWEYEADLGSVLGFDLGTMHLDWSPTTFSPPSTARPTAPTIGPTTLSAGGTRTESFRFYLSAPSTDDFDYETHQTTEAELRDRMKNGVESVVLALTAKSIRGAEAYVTTSASP